MTKNFRIFRDAINVVYFTTLVPIVFDVLFEYAENSESKIVVDKEQIYVTTTFLARTCQKYLL